MIEVNLNMPLAKFNQDIHEKLMIWPGFLRSDEPEELKEILEEIPGADFTASWHDWKEDPRRKASTFTALIKYKTHAWVSVRLIFELDGFIHFGITSRSSQIPIEVTQRISEWIITAMGVFAKYGLIG